MRCCAHCQGAQAEFGPAAARRDLKRYRRRGPDTTTKLILEGIRAASGLQPRPGRFARLLDVGGGVGVVNLVLRLKGTAFRAFVHPVDGVEKILEEKGFRRTLSRETLVWHVVVYAVYVDDAATPLATTASQAPSGTTRTSHHYRGKRLSSAIRSDRERLSFIA